MKTKTQEGIDLIEAAIAKVGLAELARQSGTGYSTVAGNRAKGWRPASVMLFEKYEHAARIIMEQRGR